MAWLHHVLGGSVLGSWMGTIPGTIFVLSVLLFRNGLVGYLQKLVNRNLR